MGHLPERFPERCDYVTTPGYLTYPGRASAPAWWAAGPRRVISHLGLMGFDEESCRYEAHLLSPRRTPRSSSSSPASELLVPDDVIETPRPTAEELRILREEVDPCQLFVFADVFEAAESLRGPDDRARCASDRPQALRGQKIAKVHTVRGKG